MDVKNKMPKFNVRNLVAGNFLVKRSFVTLLPLILLATIFIVLFIANRYFIESTVKQMDDVSKEINALQKLHSEHKGAYQRASKMLELNQKLSQKGINVSKEQIKQVIQIKEGSHN